MHHHCTLVFILSVFIWDLQCKGHIHGSSGGLSAIECKYLNERDHKFYMASQTMGGQVIFFSSYMESGPGGIF